MGLVVEIIMTDKFNFCCQFDVRLSNFAISRLCQ